MPKDINKIIEKISADEALTILHQLAERDKALKKQIAELAEALIKNVDTESICDDVFNSLDCIDVHDLWNRSGADSDGGYTSPEEMSFEMVEEELEPFNNEIFRLCDLKMFKQATEYCMGVLNGLYCFEHEAKSEFKDWASDVAGECFSYLEKEFKKRCKNKELIDRMYKYLEVECPRWVKTN